MPQRDIYHSVVRNSLIKDGWMITHDPLVLPFGRRNLYVDLGAELPIGAEKDGRRIAVEIKSFGGLSEINELEKAMGQYDLYRFLLARQGSDRSLWLALPVDAYESLFSEPEGRELIVAQAIKLLVFDPIPEVIIQWIE